MESHLISLSFTGAAEHPTQRSAEKKKISIPWQQPAFLPARAHQGVGQCIRETEGGGGGDGVGTARKPAQ